MITTKSQEGDVEGLLGILGIEISVCYPHQALLKWGNVSGLILFLGLALGIWVFRWVPSRHEFLWLFKFRFFGSKSQKIFKCKLIIWKMILGNVVRQVRKWNSEGNTPNKEHIRDEMTAVGKWDSTPLGFLGDGIDQAPQNYSILG